MKQKRFLKFSIRARVAYALVCLETLINIDDSCSAALVEILLDKLWSFTSCEFLDEWEYSTIDYLPSSILEFDNFKDFIKEESSELTELNFNLLRKDYLNIPTDIIDFINMTFSIATCNLNSRLWFKSYKTYRVLTRMVNLMKKRGLIAQGIVISEITDFSNEGGWGRKFTRKEFI